MISDTLHQRVRIGYLIDGVSDVFWCRYFFFSWDEVIRTNSQMGGQGSESFHVAMQQVVERSAPGGYLLPWLYPPFP